MRRTRALGLLLSILFSSVSVPVSAASDPNLLGWWKMDDAAGEVAADSGASGVAATLINGPTWGKGAPREGCLLLDGVDDYVVVKGAFNLPQYSIALWFRDDIAGQRDLFSGEPETVAHGVLLEVGTDGRLRYLHRFPFGGSGGSNIYAAGNFADGAWHQITAVKLATEIRLYVDGQPAGTQVDNNTFAAPLANIYFGTLDSRMQRMLAGAMDDLRIYNRALSQAEISELASRPKAHTPTPVDGAIGVNQPLLQWKPGTGALFHDVYVGTSPNLGAGDLSGARLPFTMQWYAPGFQPGVTYYWRVDEVAADMTTVYAGDVWSFTAEPLTAYVPSPADGASGLFPAPVLKWRPGKSAAQHEVYFSGNLQDVESGAAAADQGKVSAATFSPGVLRASTTYYWRIDEITAGGGVQRGSVWTFTTADGAAGKILRQWWSGVTGTAITTLTGHGNYPDKPSGSETLDAFEGPANWADNYGTRMYGWLTPPQSGAYTFWIASDDLSELWLSTSADPAKATVIARVATYTGAREWTKEAGQKSSPITLAAGQKYFIQALHKEGTGSDNLAVSWQGPGIDTQEIIAGRYLDGFALPALQAFSPSPANGAVDTVQTQVLSWSAGEKASKHDVYFGTDKAGVAGANTGSPAYQGQQAGTTFDAGDLEWGKTYYWRVDEINPAEAASPWKGTIWSFTTANFLAIDDMESYTDQEGTRIFDIWADGYVDKSSGSIVGYDTARQGTFGERQIVHSGKQSMPMDYNNINAPFYSEAARAFSPQQNWTVNGVDSLSLFWRGTATNGTGKLYVALEDSTGKVATVTNDAALTTTVWTEWKVPLSSFAGVNLSRVKVLYLGVGDRKAPAAGGAGRLYIDDIRVTKP